MRRVPILVGLTIAAAVGGVASATVIVPAGKDTLGGPRDVQPDGGAVHVSPGAPDPDGGPPWAVRVYHSVDGLTCPEAGRLADGRFGVADATGRVQARDVSAAGSCADLAKAPFALAINHYVAEPGKPARLVVFGIATKEVRSIAVETADKTIPIHADAEGEFIGAFDEQVGLSARVLVTDRAGRQQSWPLTRDLASGP